jgi:predicted RNase H-like HicB family nuclease
MSDETLKFEVIIYWSDDDGAFIAEMPELPGCMADGASPAAALENVELIAHESIETAHELGRPIPASKGRLIFA